MARRLRTVLTAPVVAVGLVISGGSLALAAAQGALDVPFTGHDNRSDRAPDAPAETNPGLQRAASGEAEGPGDPEDTDAEESGSEASPTPSMRGLCRAFQAGARAFEKEKVNPAFGALIESAGGAENVATYCVDLVGPSKKPEHPAKPDHPTKPEHPAKPEAAR